MNHRRKTEHPDRATSPLFLAVAPTLTLMLLGGCAQPRLFAARPTTAPAVEHTKMSKEELHAALDDFKDVFDSAVKQAASKIDAAATDSNVRKNTLMWQVRMISACYTICKQEDDVKVFLDVWTLCIRMTHYFEEGDGKDLFGDQQQTAVAAAKQLEADIERIAAAFLPEDQLTKARNEAVAFARDNPIRAGFTGAVVRSTTPGAGAPSAFTTIMNIPLAPFRAFEGVDRGAEAIRGFTVVADRFTDDFEALPENLRWQLLLLLIELEDNKTIGSAVASFERFSNSSARLSETADKLPEELRRQASGLIDEIDSKQGNIQTTLTQAERTAAAIERTGQSVADAGRAWEDTARAIGQTVADIRGPKDLPAPASTATQPVAACARIPTRTSGSRSTGAGIPSAVDEANRGQDAGARNAGARIPSRTPTPAPSSAGDSADDSSAAGCLNDYRRTAETLTVTATELRLFAEEARRLLDSQQLSQHIRDMDASVIGAVDQTAQQARGLTDHIAWRSAELALLIFVLAIVYRTLARRIFKKTA